MFRLFNTPPMDFTSDSMSDEQISIKTPMRNFYRGKNIFITGFTGFLGHIFVEKLLRCEINFLYILICAEGDQTVHNIITNFFSNECFNTLKRIEPLFMKHVKIIMGNLPTINSGIYIDQQHELLDNVDILIHNGDVCASDNNIEEMCINNIRVTRDLLKLADEMKKLQAFVYMSTAYSQCPQSHIKETFYKPPMDPNHFIKIIESFNSELSTNTNNNSEFLKILTKKIIKPWPNVYTFTKALTESLFQNISHKFSIAIIRPSIVISSHGDPIPAWCNNEKGIHGFIYFITMGVLRVLPVNKHLRNETICGDFVINTALAAIWKMHTEKTNMPIIESSKNVDYTMNTSINNNNIKIYNVTAKDDNKTWDHFINTMEKLGGVCSPSNIIRYPKVYTIPCPFLLTIMTILHHIIPGIFYDIYSEIFNDKKKILPIYRKIQHVFDRIRYFTLREWTFDKTNCYTLYDSMPKEDMLYFPCDIRKFDFAEFSYNYGMGLRKYIAKSSLDSLSTDRERYLKLKFYDLMTTIIYSIIGFIICYYVSIFI